jgi:hypothetical protein
MSRTPPKLRDVHTKLFSDDVAELQRIASAQRSKWQVELRQLVHRALKGERREITVLKEQV